MSPGASSVYGDDDRVDEGDVWQRLGGLGLRGILAEADGLERERGFLADGKRSLAFDNYRSFIAAAECGKEVENRVEAAADRAADAANLLPSLKEACLKFESDSSLLLERRKRLSLVLSKHTSLLEILELPQLAETAVRNGQYDQALKLKSFAGKLDKKLGHVPLVGVVVAAVGVSCQSMVNQLIASLKTAIQLPACLRVVGYLRRTEAFSETDLRLRFLQARDAWLNGLLIGIPKDDPQEHLTKTMDLTRVHLFDVVTQYRALFSDDDPLMPGISGPGHSSHRLLFSSWLSRRLTAFLKTMEADLDRVGDAGTLESVFGQAMYFGQSFGRVGADFRLSLVSVLGEAASNICMKQMNGLERIFAAGVESLTLKADLSNRPSTTDTLADPFRPPGILLDFMPLAELCNGILTGLNAVRLAAPLFLGLEVTDKVQEILESAAGTLSDRDKKFNKSSTETEVRTFKRLVSLFCNDLVPYLDRCLKAAFPPAQVQSLLRTKPRSLDLMKIYEQLPLEHRPVPRAMTNPVPELALQLASPPKGAINEDERTELISKEIDETVVDKNDHDGD